MKIRWSIVLLALFGVVAAVAAAVLTASLSAQGIQAAAPGKPKELTIIVAARDLKSMETVRSEDIVSRVVTKDDAPEAYLSDSAQVVGRVLSLPVVEGQPLTKNVFPSDTSGYLLAAHLPTGKRAVTVSLSDYSGLEGLLYPGCIVDVVASFKINGGDEMGRAVSTTLLQNIQVLGVENHTVVNKDGIEDPEPRSSRNTARRSLLVTLMVDSKQAEALQLAIEHGTVSLAMRNPGDDTLATSDATLLSGGKLAQLAELLAPKVADAETDDDSNEPVAVAALAGPATPGHVTEAADHGAVAPARADVDASSGATFWQIEVIRGMNRETTPIPVQN